jgi:hypothetical protein
MEKKLTNSDPLREPADKHSIYTMNPEEFKFGFYIVLIIEHVCPAGNNESITLEIVIFFGSNIFNTIINTFSMLTAPYIHSGVMIKSCG